MTDSSTTGAGKPLTRAALYGLVSLALYFVLYLFEDSILAFTSRGSWYFITPVLIAFVFSYFHGAFTGHFWDILGIKARK
jgi:hypothetical protein